MKKAILKETLFVAEMTVKYTVKVKAKDRPAIKSSKDAAMILRQMWGDNLEFLEEFNVLFIDRQNRVKSFYNLAKGGTSAVVVDPKVLFSTALKEMASGIFVAHNHPSGNLKPSEADNVLTKKIVEIGNLLDMQVLDHIILSPEPGEYYSYADNGRL